ncbi:glycosyl hydrolase family 28-related protein [Cerasicoccus frondis]|uniref:glycosyl hydrolase family 28-related protein n=1 Tax=Cerasicoccus frondis TaxID=490090 RepID=UPI002852AE90|nr:glycosyl hydrolase family 28-related protein [Cerasicoccus frondis]
MKCITQLVFKKKKTASLLTLALTVGAQLYSADAASASEATGESWRSDLYGENWTPPENLEYGKDKLIQDFSYAGYAMGERPIPSWDTAPTFNVLEYGADPEGNADSTEAIQQAINNASSVRGPAVVYLPAGTYHVSPNEDSKSVLRISASNVLVRGDGSDKTRILNTSTEMRGKQIIMATPQNYTEWAKAEGPVTLIRADLLTPTTRIPVESIAGFTPGEVIILRGDPTPAWIEEHKEAEGWLGYEHKIGNILYLRRIVAVDEAAQELIIDIPTRYALKVRDNACVYPKRGLLHDVGLKGFSIANVEHAGQDGWASLDFASPDGAYTKRLAEGYGLDPDFAQKKKSAYDVHFSFAIAYYGVVDGWIEDVKSYLPDGNARGSNILSNGIRLKECLNVTVANCSMGHTLYGGGGGNGYMFRLDNSNECLLEYCHAEAARHGFSLSGMATSGNVLFHCFDKDTATQAGGDRVTGGRGSDSHMYFSHSNLYDNCVADNSWFEARDRFYKKMSKPTHNTTSAQTVFWNTTGLSNSYHDYVISSVQGDYGYVIGTQGAVDQVNTEPNYPERKVVTDPVDHVEGVGQGNTLEPASLFLDQRAKRLKQES